MHLGRKEGNWMEKVDLECVGCSNDLETWTMQSRTKNQRTLGGNNNTWVLSFDCRKKENKKNKGGMWGRLLGVGFGRDRKWNE